MMEKVKHDGNPVMEWMLGCVVIDDHNENIRISKVKNSQTASVLMESLRQSWLWVVLFAKRRTINTANESR
jgi:hypothetical protein